MLQESDCWLLGKAFAPQAELSFAVSVYPVPAAASFPSGILCPLSYPRSHPVPFGGDSQAGAPPCPTSSSSVPSETPFTAGKMSQIGKPKSLSLPGLEVGSCVVWGSSDPGTELWPHPGKSHHLPRGQNCCRTAPVPVSSAASPEHLTPH